MSILNYLLPFLGIGYLAGLLGALTGLGGGVIITPFLVWLFHVDIHHAMGTALISVVATSMAASSTFLQQGYINLRIAMLLESGAAAGALIGALIVPWLSPSIVALIFGGVLLFSTYYSFKRQEEKDINLTPHAWSKALRLSGQVPTGQGEQPYVVQRVPLALGLMTIAGMLSGLLGIGSGTVKVLAMDQAMRLPYKVATATSNFMIGMTAVVGAGIYFSHGYIDPVLTGWVMIGVLLGARTGARLLVHANQQKLRLLFSLLILALASQMIYKGLSEWI